MCSSVSLCVALHQTVCTFLNGLYGSIIVQYSVFSSFLCRFHIHAAVFHRIVADVCLTLFKECLISVVLHCSTCANTAFNILHFLPLACVESGGIFYLFPRTVKTVIYIMVSFLKRHDVLHDFGSIPYDAVSSGCVVFDIKTVQKTLKFNFLLKKEFVAGYRTSQMFQECLFFCYKCVLKLPSQCWAMARSSFVLDLAEVTATNQTKGNRA